MCQSFLPNWKNGLIFAFSFPDSERCRSGRSGQSRKLLYSSWVPGVRIPLSPQYTLSVKGLRKVYTKMYTKRPEFSQFGAFLCLKCRVHSCTPVYMKKPRHKAGAHCSPMQLWGFATMWCKSSEDFTESFLSLQESSLSN